MVDVVELEADDGREVEVVAADDRELFADSQHAWFDVADDHRAVLVGFSRRFRVLGSGRERVCG